jgi:hypothetical protein
MKAKALATMPGFFHRLNMLDWRRFAYTAKCKALLWSGLAWV